MDCSATIKQRRPHEIAKFLRTFCVEDRHEATNLLLTLGLHTLNEEKARQRNSARRIQPLSVDGDVLTLRRMRELVRAVRGGNSPQKRGPSPRALVVGSSPDAKRSSSVESRQRSPRCMKCFLDAMGAMGRDAVPATTTALASRSRERSPPIRSLIERDKKQYYASTGGAAHAGPHTPTFQLVVGRTQKIPQTDRPCTEASAVLQSGAPRPIAGTSAAGAACRTDRGSRLASGASPAVNVVLHNVEAAQRSAAVVQDSQAEAAATSGVNHTDPPADPQGAPLQDDASVAVPPLLHAAGTGQNETALDGVPQNAHPRTDAAPDGQPNEEPKRMPSPSQPAHRSSASLPLPDCDGSHADIPPGALKALWAFVCRERGARRTRLVVAGALPPEWSAVTVSDAFKDVYQSLLLGYHLQASLSDVGAAP